MEWCISDKILYEFIGSFNSWYGIEVDCFMQVIFFIVEGQSTPEWYSAALNKTKKSGSSSKVVWQVYYIHAVLT